MSLLMDSCHLLLHHIFNTHTGITCSPTHVLLQ